MLCLLCVCCLSLTKVGQFEFSSLIDEQILRFQVSVKNFSFVAVRQTSK